MKLEEQVCSPIQGQKLMELGIKAPSNLHWYTGGTGNNVDVLLFGDRNGADLCYPAYTVAELMAMLHTGYSLHLSDGQYSFGNTRDFQGQYFLGAARVIAKELIILLKKGLITPEDCNKRLQD